MKLSEFSLKRLDDFAAAMEKETARDPLFRTPFGLSREGNVSSGWNMCLRQASMFSSSGGRNLFSNDDLVLITVPVTETGIEPLATDMPFGWDGKINENTAELAVWWAFEIISGIEAYEFMQKNHPRVIFSYLDSNGPGEITVKFNGNYWEISD